jgi:glycosyltransferase involved in cell wall biosynthesis
LTAVGGRGYNCRGPAARAYLVSAARALDRANASRRTADRARPEHPVTAATTPLRILMLAPEPFFEPRGTPFSEYHRIRALVELGHHVDLVTYPFGTDVDLPNLRIYRSPRPPFARRVKIGPSPLKVVLDVLLAGTALRVALRGRYDAVHSHEEAGLLGVWLARWLRVPHLYDMHSSLPQQLTNFAYSRSRPVRALFEWVERQMIGGSKVVITICQELQDTVHAMGAGDRAVLIENVMGGDVDPVAGPGRVEWRARWGLGAETPMVLYTGTFEPYQGLDLLFDAAARLAATRPAARVVVVGGTPGQVAAARSRAEGRGAPVVFTGQRPPHEIPYFVEACDLLVSPRVSGTNTPLKIYSYLRSGRPVVATDLLTHTQVLTPESAVLVPPEPGAFAAAITRLLDDPAEGQRVAAGARALAETKYSRQAYLARTRQAYEMLVRPAPAATVPAAGRALPPGANHA